MKTWQELKIKPQSPIRKLLWHRGFRYRVNYKNLPGSPDIYLSKYKTAILVNGCFWHMHENCKYSSIPKSNYDFWKNKLEGNVERDKKNYNQLESMGVKVIVVLGWEIKRQLGDLNIYKMPIVTDFVSKSLDTEVAVCWIKRLLDKNQIFK